MFGVVAYHLNKLHKHHTKKTAGAQTPLKFNNNIRKQ